MRKTRKTRKTQKTRKSQKTRHRKVPIPGVAAKRDDRLSGAATEIGKGSQSQYNGSQAGYGRLAPLQAVAGGNGSQFQHNGSHAGYGSYVQPDQADGSNGSHFRPHT